MPKVSNGARQRLSGRRRRALSSALLAAVLSGAALLGHQAALAAGLAAVCVIWFVLEELWAANSETGSEVIAGRDERASSIDLRASAAAGLVVTVALIVAWVVSLSMGHSGSPYYELGAIDGVAFVGVRIWLHRYR